MAQLYAFCRKSGIITVKHVQLAAPLQAALEPYFEVQEDLFLEGINDELPFTGDWKPDEDELLVAAGLPEPPILLAAADQNAISLPPLDAANFQNEGVRALFTALGSGPNRRLLLQNFGPQQILSTKFALLFDGNVFRRVTEPSFALGNALVAIITSTGDVKFKSFQMLRRVFDMSGVFRQATDAELGTFCAHPNLAVGNVGAFTADADERIRKDVHTITKLDVLGQNTVPHIQAQAAAINFPISIANGRIQVPQDRRGTKALLSFLLDKVYRGSLDQRLFITNSHRPL